MFEADVNKIGDKENNETPVLREGYEIYCPLNAENLILSFGGDIAYKAVTPECLSYGIPTEQGEFIVNGMSSHTGCDFIHVIVPLYIGKKVVPWRRRRECSEAAILNPRKLEIINVRR